jgi:hypothetical protein
MEERASPVGRRDSAGASSTASASRHGLPVLNPEAPPSRPVDPNLQDATELETWTPETGARSPSTISSGSVCVVARCATHASTMSAAPTGPFAPFKRFWRRHVVLPVPQKQSRDHFGMVPHSFLCTLGDRIGTAP